MYNPNEKIELINVADEVSRSFLDYSMSVIISRALPDARDGLKPSQRRILYAMHDLSLFPNRQHRKCAKICGDTSGNYHPHGEAVIYPTLVHMAQAWAMRETLVDGQGNFGSVEGDPPAAMRYTEARMTHLGAALMVDMDKDTVDFVPNYDETRTEPTVFPAAFPNLLVNGGTGIAVGMATNMPPHNLGEVIDGICAQIDDPDITIDDLRKHVKGPDFPTGCAILGLAGIKQYLETGRGSMKVRGKAGVEELKGNREQIVITEIPYNVNRATLVERIADLVNDKVLSDITAIRDESDENTRVVIELKRDANPKIVINNLSIRRAVEELKVASSYEQVRSILLAAFDSNDFDAFELQLKSLSGDQPGFGEPQKPFHWTKTPHIVSISSMPSWKLTLELVTTANRRRGSLTVYRVYSQRGLQLDVNLLTSVFPVALAWAQALGATDLLVRAVLANHRGLPTVVGGVDGDLVEDSAP
jgi:hypothetical protein